QFGHYNAKNEARTKLETMKQGNRSMTEFWNEFRLTATEAESDEDTGLIRTLLRAMNEIPQNDWKTVSTPFETAEAMARWAIEQENKNHMIQHFQGKHKSAKSQEIPRNHNGMFRP